MSTKKSALKKLAVKIGCAASVKEVKGDTIAEVIQFMDENAPFGVHTEYASLFELEFDADGPYTEEDGRIYYCSELLGRDVFDLSNIDPSRTYTVIFDGKNYTCPFLITNFGGMHYVLGNPSLCTTFMDGGNGEPFAIYQTGSHVSVYVSTPGYHTISVLIGEEQVKTLDPKFVPGGNFVINLTMDDEFVPYTDKTYDEIMEALNTGMYPVIDTDVPVKSKIPFTGFDYNGERMSFTTLIATGNSADDENIPNFEWVFITCKSDNTWSLSMTRFEY